jgi:DNA polymerase-4
VADGATILHADLDAFYASVEQLLDPSLRGQPIAVGGGVVLAASYEAKRFGVHGGMSGREARQRCPGLRFVRGHFHEYQRLGDQVMAVLGDFTPLVQRISIDEAFLDVGGSAHLFGEPRDIAVQIRARVRDELGLPISVGVARTKHLAKVASQVAKPDGLVVVPAGEEHAFLHPLPVGLLWGVGPVTRARLASRGIRTIGELAASSDVTLQSLLGRTLGGKVRALAADDDPRRVRAGGPAGSVGAQSALGRREPTPELVRVTLGHLADRIATRLRAKGRAGRTVTVRVRFADLRAITRSITVREPVAATLTLTEIAEGLVTTALAEHAGERWITLLAISVSNLSGPATVQLELPFASGGLTPAGAVAPGPAASPAAVDRAAIDRSIDAVRARFGRQAVGYASVVFGRASSVPDDFRELAERD